MADRHVGLFCSLVINNDVLIWQAIRFTYNLITGEVSEMCPDSNYSGPIRGTIQRATMDEVLKEVYAYVARLRTTITPLIFFPPLYTGFRR